MAAQKSEAAAARTSEGKCVRKPRGCTFALAKEYGFASWRALKAHIDSRTLDGQLVDAARSGDATTVASLLEAHPEKLHVRAKPYGMTLLHLGARSFDVVDLLLQRGADVNARENGDNTYAMHWAAANGALDVVRRLADAGGDVIGEGADHFLTVLGWATCFDLHEAVARFLISRGARHHVFSAVAMNDAEEVRRIERSVHSITSIPRPWDTR